MNKQEKELDELVKDVESINVTVPPLFELYATLFSIAVSIMLFAFPNMIYQYPARLYDNMMYLMPQYLWALGFFSAAMIKSFGLLFNQSHTRIVGLCSSTVLYSAMSVCYAIDFPNIGTVTFICMAVFTIVSIPFVKHTSIKYKKED